MANKKSLHTECSCLEKMLHDRGFTHLNVIIRGTHLVIYSQDGEDKINRARLTNIKDQQYQLSMADHRGRWEPTPFIGSCNEITEMLTTDFSFALIDY